FETEAMNRTALLLGSIALIAGFTETGAARAENYFGLRVGGSFTEDGEAKAKAFGTTIDRETVGFDASVNGGIRLGLWSESVPWVGAAVDASYLGADVDGSHIDLDVVPVSLMLMLRLPLGGSEEDSPRGRLRPYVGIGPGVFVSLVDADAIGFSDTS